MPAVNVATSRPAEVSGVAAAVAVLIVHLLGVTDADVLVSLTIVVGAIPAVVTFLVNLVRKRNGGTG